MPRCFDICTTLCCKCFQGRTYITAWENMLHLPSCGVNFLLRKAQYNMTHCPCRESAGPQLAIAVVHSRGNYVTAWPGQLPNNTHVHLQDLQNKKTYLRKAERPQGIYKSQKLSRLACTSRNPTRLRPSVGASSSICVLYRISGPELLPLSSASSPSPPSADCQRKS